MIIRKVTEADRIQITDLLNTVIEIGGTTAYLSPVTPDFFDRFLAPETDQTFLFVADASGEIVGMQWMSPGDMGLGIIATFAKPDTVQRGIGTQLFAATKAESIETGYTELDATIRADNTGGLAFYSKMGFVDVDVEKAKPLADGTKVDRIVKRMRLSPPQTTSA
jgi:L-amino acid N-acyltransferase YncA